MLSVPGPETGHRPGTAGPRGTTRDRPQRPERAFVSTPSTLWARCQALGFPSAPAVPVRLFPAQIRNRNRASPAGRKPTACQRKSANTRAASGAWQRFWYHRRLGPKRPLLVWRRRGRGGRAPSGGHTQRGRAPTRPARAGDPTGGPPRAPTSPCGGRLRTRASTRNTRPLTPEAPGDPARLLPTTGDSRRCPCPRRRGRGSWPPLGQSRETSATWSHLHANLKNKLNHKRGDA